MKTTTDTRRERGKKTESKEQRKTREKEDNICNKEKKLVRRKGVGRTGMERSRGKQTGRRQE